MWNFLPTATLAFVRRHDLMWLSGPMVAYWLPSTDPFTVSWHEVTWREIA